MKYGNFILFKRVLQLTTVSVNSVLPSKLITKSPTGIYSLVFEIPGYRV